MNKHYFIAIKIPKHIASAIIQERDKTNLQQTHKVLPVEEDLHITLYYLGHVAEETLRLIKDSLQLLEWDSFELTTRGVAHFGNDITPRVVYTALDNSDPLYLLQQKIVERLANFIEIQKKNDFTAHITIAKKWAAKKSVHLANFALPDLDFNVDSFSIYTVNVNHSPRYEIVSTFLSRGGK